jgi:hypothetical protein
LKKPLSTLSDNWHEPIKQPKVHGWRVSDNGEDVTAFGPNGQQANFGWRALGQGPRVAALIEKMGHDAFVAKLNVWSHRDREALDDWESTLDLERWEQPGNFLLDELGAPWPPPGSHVPTLEELGLDEPIE